MEELVSKFKKELIKTVLFCSAALIVLVAVSIAWFASNDRVQMTSVTVSANTHANLAIGKDMNELKAYAYDTYKTMVEFDQTSHYKLVGATHDNDIVAYPSGLKYVTNPGAVSPTTGLAGATAAVLEFAAVENDPLKRRFFAEYEVFVASVVEPMENRTLTASLMSEQLEAALEQYPHRKALSVDFYIRESMNSADSLRYKGTLNLAGHDSTGVELAEVELYTGQIPFNKEGALAILMRVYFDGALGPVDGSSGEIQETYLRTQSVDLSEAMVHVSFDAKPAAAGSQ